MKRDHPTYGSIRVRNVARGISYPNVEGWHNIPAWSQGGAPWKELSPFLIGPVHYEGQVCNTFETFWQSFKVWAKVDKQTHWSWSWPAEEHVDAEGNVNAAWHVWHKALFKNKHAVRRPNGRAIPLYAWFEGEKLDVIEARKRIYIPYLQALYRKSKVYQELLDMVKNGQDIIILEPDGPPHEFFPDGMPVDMALLEKLQNVTELKDFPGITSSESKKYVPFGHGYVIAMTLLQDL
ncbi:MAG: hypothetical protein K2Q45_05405 [Nitrosomonas sp.]|nr:hypothetical protein [Nitrosomonas sp.]